jgi:hypothetical protein
MWKRKALTAMALSVALAAVAVAQAPPQSSPGSAKSTLTTQDYIDIQQLVARYAYAIDNCTNNGYDYADLARMTVVRGVAGAGFPITNHKDATGSRRPRGSAKTCDEVPWKGITHLLVNHVIAVARRGDGKIYLVAVGLNGDPGKVEAQGHYEDVYAKTADGWRSNRACMSLAAGQTAVSRGAAPARPAEPGK